MWAYDLDMPTKTTRTIKPVGRSKPAAASANKRPRPAQRSPAAPKAASRLISDKVQPIVPPPRHDYLVEALNPDGSILVIFGIRDVSGPEEARTRIEAVLAGTYPPVPTRIGTIILDPPPRRPHIERKRLPGPLTPLLSEPVPVIPSKDQPLPRQRATRKVRA